MLPIYILASTIQCHAMTLILQAFSGSKTILNYNIFHIFPCKKVSLKKKTCILQWLTCLACLALLQFVIKNQKRKLNILCKSILTSRCTLRKPNTSMFANSQKRSKFKQYITINLKKIINNITCINIKFDLLCTKVLLYPDSRSISILFLLIIIVKLHHKEIMIEKNKFVCTYLEKKCSILMQVVVVCFQFFTLLLKRLDQQDC